MKPIFTDHHPARRTQCALTANSYQLAATRAQASAHTPAKMASEMLEADRRARKRRHRARRAHAVHAAPLIRPETFEPGKHPCHFGASPAQQRKAAAAQRLYRRLDLIIAAILWGLALVCVGLTLAIATGIALHLFGVE